MDAFKSLLQPLSSSAVGSGVLDATKLVILGGTVETARRAASSGWSSFINSFYLTAHFSEEDYPYDWLLLWLQKQPAWSRSREFETTTCTVTATGNSNRHITGEEVEEEDVEDVIEEDDGRPRLKVLFQPTVDTTHTIYYKGHWLRIRRSKKTDGSELAMLSISVVARSNGILKQLVLQAKKEYEQECVDRVQIYFADQHGSWRWTDSRHKRPLSSIVLNKGVIEMLLADTKDFLRSEKWYANRGIPYRRGYLLHGTPGSGKSSLIHAIAGELALDVYVVSLSASWVNDSSLTTLLGRIPARSILLLEDIDAAFTRSTSRDSDSSGTPDSSRAIGPETKKEDAESKASADTNTLTLSGLLNALDGMQASESRILFCTTNHLERLDPALSRPGRMDVWIEFRNASKFQAEGLFRNFFPAAEEIDETDLPTPSLFSTSSMSASTLVPGAPGSLPTPAVTPPVDDAPKSLKDALPSLESASALGSNPLDAARLAELAKIFADSIPDEEFSVAELQGYLLKNKARPEEAASQVSKWVIKEREMRERLAREKEEKEEKERLAKDKRRKEREEKKAKEEREKEDKSRKEKEEADEKSRKQKEEAEEKTRKEKEEAEVKARKEKGEKEKVTATALVDKETEVAGGELRESPSPTETAVVETPKEA